MVRRDSPGMGLCTSRTVTYVLLPTSQLFQRGHHDEFPSCCDPRRQVPGKAKKHVYNSEDTQGKGCMG